jgi:hypothetical protein
MRIRFMLIALVLLVAGVTSQLSTQNQNTAGNRPSNIEIAAMNMASIGMAAFPLAQTTAEATPEPTPEVTDAPVRFPAAIPGALGPVEFPPNVNPLTGLVVTDPAVLDRRPIVAKISNAPALVRPQSGIGQADLVFEHYTEAGLTRFSAIFYSQAPTRVGSIRSARLIDYELVPMVQGLLAFSGASIGVEKVIYGWADVATRIPGSDQTGPLVPLPPSEFADRAYKGVLYGLPYYFRDETIPVPHNMFFNAAALWELAAEDGYGQRPALEGMAFHPDAPGRAAGTGAYVDLRYLTTRVEWHYNPDDGLYYRTQDGQRHFDVNTNQQISAANIVILYAHHQETDIIESQFENNIAWSIQITLTGEGDAVLLRDGQRYEGRWVRNAQVDVIGLRTTDGQLLYLKPGVTFFQVVPLPEQQNPAEESLNIG